VHFTGVGDGAAAAASFGGGVESVPASVAGLLESTEVEASATPPSDVVVSELLHATSDPHTREDKAKAWRRFMLAA
jgi:hypothetical protein